MPEQALDGIPLVFGIVIEDKPSELSYSIHSSTSIFTFTPVNMNAYHYCMYLITTHIFGSSKEFR